MMNTEITQLIERYLQGELEQADRLVFEARMQTDPQLKSKVEAQQLVREASKRAAQRELIRKTGKRYHLRKTLTTTAIVFGLAGAAAVAVWTAVKYSKSGSVESVNAEQIDALKEELKGALPIADLAVQYFSLTSKDTVILSENGVLLSVPDAAFLLNGKPYAGPKVVQWQEAMDASSIVKSGLSTMSGNRLLETQGMFSMQAFTPEGKKLDVNPKVGVYVQVPVDEVKSGMKLFEGVPEKNGKIDWQNPQPLEKFPVMADMKDLDFYPPGYEPKLNELKWKQGKKQRDSLYLSFDEGKGNVKPLTVYRMGTDGANYGFLESAPVQSKHEPFNSSESSRANELTPVKAGTADNTTINPILKNGIYNIQNPTYKFQDNPSAKVQYAGMNFVRNDRLNLEIVCSMLDDKHARLLILGTIKGAAQLVPTPAGDFFGLPGGDAALKIKHVRSEQQVKKGNLEITAVYDLTLTAPAGTVSNLPLKGSFLGDSRPEQFTFPIVFEEVSRETDILADSVATAQHIAPSSILAFWKPKFNNTILATRDVEKRIRAAHGTCNQKIVDAYTKNLGKKIWEIDEKVAAMGYPEFKEFAAERVGGVELSNPHLENLRKFYEKGIDQLQEAARNDRNFARKLEQSWDESVSDSRKKEETRKEDRKKTNLKEEYELNLKDVSRQLGKSVGFQIHGGGTVYNIDKYVMDATVARASTTITDPETGKMAKIVYNDFKVNVKDSKDYERVFVYLFPHELNSYQRIDPENGGRFSYPLNNIIQYDVAVIGISDEGFFLYQQKSVKGGDLGDVALKQLSESEFNNAIEQLNKGRIHRPDVIHDELSWLITEQKNYKVKKQRKANAAFREEVKGVVFPCTEWIPEEWAVPDSAAVEHGIQIK